MHCDKRYSATTFLFVLLISFCNVYAQLPGGQFTQPNATGKLKPVKNRNQLKADSMLAMTKPGYYRDRHREQANPNRSALRTTDCGDGYLCSPRSLPVRLISFTGLRTSESEVKLYWETVMEENNAGFEVERSIEGTGDFQSVGRVDPGSSKMNKYTLVDINTDSDLSYYRLKQMDLDGSFTYSSVISVQGFKKVLSVHANPNPGRQSDIYFQVTNASAKTIDLAIYSVSGLVLYSNKSYKLDGNKRIILQSLTRLHSGSYVVKVKSGEDETAVPFVVVN
jgi:hypothetical protein